jgi:hypothetical protein
MHHHLVWVGAIDATSRVSAMLYEESVLIERYVRIVPLLWWWWSMRLMRGLESSANTHGL